MSRILTIALPSTCLFPPIVSGLLISQRYRFQCFSTVTSLLNQPSSSSYEPVPSEMPSRWLSDLKKRVGKCILFGCNEEQVQEAGRISQELASNWRELVAGSEGFLTTEGRPGLFRRPVEWGEQDSMVGSS
jgi:hypothetical protein